MGLEGCIGAPQAAADRGGQESSSPRWVGPLPREEARWRPRPCIPGSGLNLQPTELPGATQVSHVLPTARFQSVRHPTRLSEQPSSTGSKEASHPTPPPHPHHSPWITGLAGPRVAAQMPVTETQGQGQGNLVPGRQGVDGLETFTQAPGWCWGSC